MTNLFEYNYGSTANDWDTDGDGMRDGWEYDNGLDLFTDDANLDPNNDSLTNLEEYQNDTDPFEEDTDGDTWNDGDEVDRGTDPLDPNDYPHPSAQAISGYYLVSLICLISIVSSIIAKKIRLNIKKRL